MPSHLVQKWLTHPGMFSKILDSFIPRRLRVDVILLYFADNLEYLFKVFHVLPLNTFES